MWLRYVLVPGLTDDESDINNIAMFAARLGNVARVDVLPFHQMGRYKWKKLALNYVLDITFPAFNNQGGTLVVPGHGRICNESDVAEYRDMTTIIRDRIQLMVDKKMTLAQIKAAGPTKDYDGVYSTPAWTGEMFIEAIYADLTRTR